MAPISGSSPNKTFSRSDGSRSGSTTWTQSAAASRGVQAADQDFHDNDIATAINTCLFKDGGNAATGNLPMGGNKLTGLGAGASSGDSAEYSQMVAADAVVSAACLHKDGTTNPTANIPMAGFKLTGLAAGTVNGDALRYEQLAASEANFIRKDGTTNPAANLPMAGFKLTGLAAGASNGDSVRYEQLTAVSASIGKTLVTDSTFSGAATLSISVPTDALELEIEITDLTSAASLAYLYATYSVGGSGVATGYYINGLRVYGATSAGLEVNNAAALTLAVQTSATITVGMVSFKMTGCQASKGKGFLFSSYTLSGGGGGTGSWANGTAINSSNTGLASHITLSNNTAANMSGSYRVYKSR